MDRIKIADKTFEVTVPESEIHRCVKDVADRINRDMAGKTPVFLPVLNGSFYFAADLFHMVTIPCELSFIKVSSYEGTKSTGKVGEIIGINQDLKDRTIIIVEDIVDTGLTIKYLMEKLVSYHPASIHVCTMLAKPNRLKVDVPLDYVAMSIPDDFIVGHGLDYCGLGRNLPDIYVVVDE